MTYIRQEWVDASAAHPVSAARMGHLEDGVWRVHNTADTAYSTAVAAGDLAQQALDAANTTSGLPLFNVHDYGALGQGADDAPGIQAAMDAAAAAGAGTVLIPGGRTYNIGAAVRPGANTTVWAYDATIRSTAAGLLYNHRYNEGTPQAPTWGGYDGPGNIRIFGGVWDANGDNLPDGFGFNGMLFTHAADILLRDLSITNVLNGHALELNGCNRVLVDNCQFLGFRPTAAGFGGDRTYAEAIQLDASNSAIGADDGTTCANVVIRGCTVGPSVRLGTWGRAVGSHGAGTNGLWHWNIQVVGNRVTSTLQEGIAAYCWRRSRIADNIITGTGKGGILVTTANPAGGDALGVTIPAGLTLPIDSVTVSGNLIDGAGLNGVEVRAYATALALDVQITGNTMRNVTGVGVYATSAPAIRVAHNNIRTTTGAGVNTTLCDDAQVQGNQIIGAASLGVFAAGSAGSSIVGNTIDGAGSHAVGLALSGSTAQTDTLIASNNVRNGGGAGVRVVGACLRYTVTGNQVRKGTGAGTQGVNVDAAATGGVVVGNDFSGNGWTAAAALTIAAGAGTRTDYAGGTAVPGHNLI